MKENRLVITIQCSPDRILEFCLNPKNTPRWIPSIILEETDGWPVRVGTIYKNKNARGEWSRYEVVSLSPAMFEFKMVDSSYHVRYTVRPRDAFTTELEYYEWVDNGNLAEPFTIERLHKLKAILESSFVE